MRTMRSIVMRMIGFLAMLTMLCGVVYPLVVTGVAQAAFGDKARGSIIEMDGRQYGSELLAQPFTGEEYLWGRPMNIDVSTYTNDGGEPLLYAGAFNKTPAGEELEAIIAERVTAIRKAHPEKGNTPIPVDLVTGSGSGLDPHISVAAVDYQIARIAQARGLSPSQVREIVLQYTDKKWLGILGEETVNVLKVNLALDGILKE